jgi:hypothetical protein
MGNFDRKAVFAPGSREANDNLRRWLCGRESFDSAPRTVLHYAYPCHDADRRTRSDVAGELRSRGFAVGDASLRDGLVFWHEATVFSGGFDEITAELAALLASFGWEYDAWECAPRADPALVYWRVLEGLPLR